ncbi:unnamed protein product, partial [Rotaria sordida]
KESFGCTSPATASTPMDPDEPPPTRASASAALSNISTLSSDVVLLSDSEDSLSNILEEEIMDLNSQLNRKNSVELLNNVFSLNCMCEYHQNPALLLTALNRLMNSRYELTSFIKLMICEQETNDCYSRECSMCNTNLPSSFFIEQLKAKEVNEDDDVTWMIWERNEKRTELQRHTTSITTLLEKLDSLWSKFLIHNFYTIEQREYIKKIKSESSEKGTAVVQLDFAENFTLLSQAAVQSSYWSQKQAPVFTVHIKMGTGHRNLVFISDYMKYTTEFVDQAQRTINDFIKKWYPNVKKM